MEQSLIHSTLIDCVVSTVFRLTFEVKIAKKKL